MKRTTGVNLWYRMRHLILISIHCSCFIRCERLIEINATDMQNYQSLGTSYNSDLDTDNSAYHKHLIQRLFITYHWHMAGV